MRGFVKMMMMLCIGIKQAIFIMHCYAAQQPGICELIQCVIHRAASYMQTRRVNFGCQIFRRDMPMPPIKQQTGNRHPLSGRPQPGIAQF